MEHPFESVMKQYPTIERAINKSEYIYAFDKLDGSNIRAEWTRKKGFWKFGSRTQLIDESSDLGEAISLIVQKYGSDLSNLFEKHRFKKVICFFEYWGKNSFAGTHLDETHDVTLFDISVHKHGIITPKQFLDLTKGLDTPKLLYHGKANSELVEAVKLNQLKGMTLEGVVCKGKLCKPGLPIMFKIKSHDWLFKLKRYCKLDEELYEKLK